MDIIRATSRGITKTGWLTSYHTFSFNRYHDPGRMGFDHVRVFNDDLIAPGSGFGEHGHDNMEIITFVLNGVLEHKDSSGGGGILKFGDVQVMSAGKGIMHSEFNHSDTDPLELFQIWINTKKQDLKPRYDQKTFSFPKNKLTKVVGGKKDDPLFINQDAELYFGEFDKHSNLVLKKNSLLFIIEGLAKINDIMLKSRDTLLIDKVIGLEIFDRTRFLLIIC